MNRGGDRGVRPQGVRREERLRTLLREQLASGRCVRGCRQVPLRAGQQAEAGYSSPLPCGNSSKHVRFAARRRRRGQETVTRFDTVICAASPGAAEAWLDAASSMARMVSSQGDKADRTLAPTGPRSSGTRNASASEGLSTTRSTSLSSGFESHSLRANALRSRSISADLPGAA